MKNGRDIEKKKKNREKECIDKPLFISKLSSLLDLAFSLYWGVYNYHFFRANYNILYSSQNKTE